GASHFSTLARSPALANLQTLKLRDGGDGFWLANLDESDLFPSLTRLDLSNNAVTDGGLEGLLRWPGISRLTHLMLSANLIYDRGAVALAEHPGVKRLMALDLTKNRIADTGAKALVESPHLAAMRWVSLGGNRKISHPLRKELAKRYPGRV